MNPWPIRLAAALLLAPGCAPDAQREPEPLVPEYAGCREQLADGTCILDAGRTLVVVTPGEQAVHWSTDRGRVTVRQRAELGSDMRETLVVGGETHVLEGQVGDDHATRYRLKLSNEALPDSFSRALALRDRGEFAAAERLVKSTPALSAENEVRRTFLLGRIALSHSDFEHACPLLWQAARAAEKLGLLSIAVDAANMVGYAEAQFAHAPERAQQALEFARGLARPYSKGLAINAYNAAILAHERGDLRASLALLAEAERAAERLDNEELRNSASDEHANTLTRLGRYEDAQRVHAKLLERVPVDNVCVRARLLGNAGWTLLNALSEQTSEDAPAFFARAHGLLGEAATAADRCANPSRRTNAHINLALLALSEQDARAASSELAIAESASPSDAFTAPWKLEATGRLALLEKRGAEAARVFARELQLARAAGDDEAVFRSLVGRARAEALDDKLDQSAQSYRDAEQVLDRLVWSVPLGAGRGLFLDARDASSEGLVDVLMRWGEPAQAHQALRHALARSEALVAASEWSTQLPAATSAQMQRLLETHHTLRQQVADDARNDWSLSDQALAAATRERERKLEQSNEALDRALALASQHLPSEELGQRTPAPGTLFLSFMPLGSQDLLAFAQTPAGTRAVRIKRPATSEKLGEQLLAPFGREIRAAERIELRTAGALSGLDLHAVEVDARPLVSYAPVAYAVETRARADAHAGSGVLVIADPTHGLPYARKEGEDVARSLGQESAVTLLSGPRATRAAVLSALPGSQLVHFAGHGRLGSMGPLDQRLELADSGALAISDVLALAQGPENVVLSACDAGSAPERSDVPRALGLAQAFVTRGARAVIAPVRPVEDGASRELVERLYANYRTSHDLVLALRDTQVGLSQQSENDTWKSFRAWVR